MLIRIGYDLAFELPRPTPMLLMLYVHPQAAPALRHPERILVEPETTFEDVVDWFGNRAARILAPAGELRIRYDNLVADGGRPQPRIGRLLVARGRDAVDVALTTPFGTATLTRLTVWTDEVEGP
jgi:transglutaminase-like putative cysteine protease